MELALMELDPEGAREIPADDGKDQPKDTCSMNRTTDIERVIALVLTNEYQGQDYRPTSKVDQRSGLSQNRE